MALFIGLCCSHFSCFCSDFKQWRWGDRSHSSSVPIIRRPMAFPMTFPRPHFVVSSAASVGDLVVVAPGPPRSVVVSVEFLMLGA
jgi:hypothetical protein